MQTTRHDAIVVGTGQAGPALAAALAAAGRRVAVIERGAFGGTCVNNGCTPTKAMVASAYAARGTMAWTSPATCAWTCAR
jgi:pyruvate/2-oxoglutarate dehydrogenase complex dihydrolipoamide dehydrogenase (E3) component